MAARGHGSRKARHQSRWGAWQHGSMAAARAATSKRIAITWKILAPQGGMAAARAATSKRIAITWKILAPQGGMAAARAATTILRLRVLTRVGKRSS